MTEIEEVLRMLSPAPRPQSLAFADQVLWMGSIDTCRLYAIDPVHWTVREEAKAPGKPWGMTVAGDELRVLCGEGDDDTRIIRKYIPGRHFHHDWQIPAPNDTGSQLGFDGDRLYVSQWYNKKILSIDDSGKVGTIIDVPRGICGQVIVHGIFYLLTTDDEDSNDYFITRVDDRDGKPKVEDVAHVPFQGRALAFDGQKFWSNHREKNEIVAFAFNGFKVE